MRGNISFSAGLTKSARLGLILGLTVASGLASALMTSRPSHAEDDYVSSMRSEGHKLEPLNRNPAAADENTEKPVKDFEAALLLDSPDSFRIYRQLTPEKRQAIYLFYLGERNLKTVRRRIIDLRLGS